MAFFKSKIDRKKRASEEMKSRHETQNGDVKVMQPEIQKFEAKVAQPETLKKVDAKVTQPETLKKAEGKVTQPETLKTVEGKSPQPRTLKTVEDKPSLTKPYEPVIKPFLGGFGGTSFDTNGFWYRKTVDKKLTIILLENTLKVASAKDTVSKIIKSLVSNDLVAIINYGTSVRQSKIVDASTFNSSTLFNEEDLSNKACLYDALVSLEGLFSKNYMRTVKKEDLLFESQIHIAKKESLPSESQASIDKKKELPSESHMNVDKKGSLSSESNIPGAEKASWFSGGRMNADRNEEERIRINKVEIIGIGTCRDNGSKVSKDVGIGCFCKVIGNSSVVSKYFCLTEDTFVNAAEIGFRSIGAIFRNY